MHLHCGECNNSVREYVQIIQRQSTFFFLSSTIRTIAFTFEFRAHTRIKMYYFFSDLFLELMANEKNLNAMNARIWNIRAKIFCHFHSFFANNFIFSDESSQQELGFISIREETNEKMSKITFELAFQTSQNDFNFHAEALLVVEIEQLTFEQIVHCFSWNIWYNFTHNFDYNWVFLLVKSERWFRKKGSSPNKILCLHSK